ncbi:dihydrolipoyl dehydrogenase [Enterococcus sp. AZ103]
MTLDFSKTQKWKDQQVVKTLTNGIRALLKKNGVTIMEGFGSFLDKKTLQVKTKNGDEKLMFKQAIIATGSSPIEIPNFKFEGRVIDSTGGLNLKEIPKELIVVGGGYIGCELAGAYANLGAKVTIVEGSSNILPAFESDIQALVVKGFKEKNIRVVTSAKALKADQTNDSVTIEIDVNEKKEKMTADYVMVTVGRKSNTANLGLDNLAIMPDSKGLIPVSDQYQTQEKNIYAIGDVVAGLALAHKASYEAKVAAEVIAGKNVKKDYRVIPAVCFTDPEVATVGLTKKEAQEAGLKVSTANFPMQANGRALSLNATEGFVRLVFEKDTELVVGAQIVGVNASDLVAEITLAIESYLTLEDIALTIHGHPTLSEMVMDASEVGLGLPIHM